MKQIPASPKSTSSLQPSCFRTADSDSALFLALALFENGSENEKKHKAKGEACDSSLLPPSLMPALH